MRRREFMALAGSLAAWPMTARAQNPKMVARIGFLGAASASAYSKQVEAFRLGLRDVGYVEGRDVVIEYVWAEGDYARLPALAAELVRAKVDVIVTHGTPAGLSVKAATATIPVVIASIGDAVDSGIVASLARPGGNITGQSFFGAELAAKSVELLKEMMPKMVRLALLTNPDNPSFDLPQQALKLNTAAQALGVKLRHFAVRSPVEFEPAFKRMAEDGFEAVAIADDALLNTHTGILTALAWKERIASVGNRAVPLAGGLMGYGVDYFATFRRAAVFVDKVLKGTPPADIPIEQAAKFEIVVNLRTAKAFGLTIPPSLLARADELIE